MRPGKQINDNGLKTGSNAATPAGDVASSEARRGNAVATAFLAEMFGDTYHQRESAHAAHVQDMDDTGAVNSSTGHGDTAEQHAAAWEVKCLPVRRRKYDFEFWLDAASALAHRHLRARPTLPRDSCAVNSGTRLPLVCCAFSNCTWAVDATRGERSRASEQHESISQHAANSFAREQGEHVWDKMLQDHVRAAHSDVITSVISSVFGEEQDPEIRAWDVHKEAIAVREREGFPSVGCSVDRRAMEYTMQVYNDKSIKALICCVCACVRVDTGGVRSQIEFRSGNWFFNLPRGSLKNNSL